MSCGICIATLSQNDQPHSSGCTLPELSDSRRISFIAEHKSENRVCFRQMSMLCTLPTKSGLSDGRIRSHHCRGGTEDWEENLAAQIEAMIARESEAAAERVRVKRAAIMKVDVLS